MDASSGLKTVYDLLNKQFFVEYYQRGYRWTDLQVKNLLDDIWEFATENSKNNETGRFYCLQPIIVKLRNNKGTEYEVIDGQQRLTIIGIILYYLIEVKEGKKLSIMFPNNEIYQIKYARHADENKSPQEFYHSLQELQEEEARRRGPDIYHMYCSYKTVDKWFSENANDYTNQKKFFETLLSSNDTDNIVKVIWYEVPQGADSSKIFKRINIGKIPLTSSELIRALFMKNIAPKGNKDGQHAGERYGIIHSKSELKRIQIAMEWDRIENKLHDSNFWWSFTSNKEKNSVRIDEFFKLYLKCELGNDAKYSKYFDDTYGTFHYFYDQFKEQKGSDQRINIGEDIWKKVRARFQILEDWHKDFELYHLVGYVIATNYSMPELLKIYEKKKIKEEFMIKLVNIIKGKIDYENWDSIADLRYGEDTQRIKDILLFHNIATILKCGEKGDRFPYSKYKEREWDIEHILARKQDKIENADKEGFLSVVNEYLKNREQDTVDGAEKGKMQKLRADIDEFYKEPEKINDDAINSEEFNEFCNRVFELDIGDEKDSEIKEEMKDTIGNLALLSSHINRAYKNVPFRIKRACLIKYDLERHFIPPCTRNVFLKYYSTVPQNILLWNKHNAQDYEADIKQTIADFFNKKEK